MSTNLGLLAGGLLLALVGGVWSVRIAGQPAEVRGQADVRAPLSFFVAGSALACMGAFGPTGALVGMVGSLLAILIFVAVKSWRSW